MFMNEEDYKDLKQAKLYLEKPSIAMQAANIIGKPIEWGIDYLPEKAKLTISKAVNISMSKALEYVSSPYLDFVNLKLKGYKAVTLISGALSGLFGLAGLGVELPITTMVMLKSILDIAKENGENINDVNTKLACLEVFAMGGKSKNDDAAETGYYAIRIALSRAISEAAEFIAEKGIVKEGAPVIVKFLVSISERFGIAVSEKAALQAAPVAGAVGGAGINYIFTDHFQKAALGHFTVRRLERIYSPDYVKSVYDEIKLD